MTRKSVLFVSLLLLCASGAYAQEVQQKPVDTITIAELRDHIFYLASDYLEGRYTGSKGYEIAAEYCASQFAAAGLSQICTDTDGKATFLQTVPMATRSIKEEIVLTLATPSGRTEFLHVDDFKWADGELLPSPETPRGIVFIGYGIEEPEHGWNDFENLDLNGKTAVMIVGAPVRDGVPVLPEEIHNSYLSLPGLNTKIMPLIEKHPAALLIIAEETVLGMWDQIPVASASVQMTYAGPGTDVFIPMIMAIKPEVAEALLSGQSYDPGGSAAVDLDRYRTFELNGVSMTMKVEVVDEEVPSWNVVGMVEGTDPELKNQYVTVTANLDHLEPRNGQVMNGADDNASGCAGVMEIAEAIAMKPLRRSVIFALFTKEEGGGIGSRHFVAEPPVPLESIVVNLNLDMIGRTHPSVMEKRTHWALNSDTVTPELTEIIRNVNARTIKWDLEYSMEAGFGSDDTMFRMKGIPAVFFFSGPHPDYHTPNDDPEKIEWDKTQALSQLVYHLAVEIGNMDRSIRP